MTEHAHTARANLENGDEDFKVSAYLTHCETCVCGRRAPVQRGRGKPEGTVAWWEHEQAWVPYGARYSQSAERIAERGGFSYGEIVDQLGHEPTTWSPRGR